MIAPLASLRWVDIFKMLFRKQIKGRSASAQLPLSDEMGHVQRAFGDDDNKQPQQTEIMFVLIRKIRRTHSDDAAIKT